MGDALVTMPALTTSSLPNTQHELYERALSAIARYRERHAFPSQEVIDGLRERLTQPAPPGSQYDWRDALDVAMWDAGYAIEWQGNEIFEVTRRA